MDYTKLFRMDGKVAVVCGGLGLIGKEVSIALAQLGAKVIILDTDKKKFVDCKDFYFGLDIHFIKFDVIKLHSYKISFKQIFDDYGHIDVFVNASYPRTKDWNTKFQDVTTESWNQNVNIQLNSSCIMVREIAELMKKNKIKGSIVNFGSTYGVVGPDFSVYNNTDMTCPAAYSAIKGGIINFTRYAASYYGKYNIRVNCLCPGGVYNNQPKSFVEEYNKKTLLGRMAKPEEIASATLFLASDASSYMTGAVMMVDGGWTAV